MVPGSSPLSQTAVILPDENPWNVCLENKLITIYALYSNNNFSHGSMHSVTFACFRSSCTEIGT